MTNQLVHDPVCHVDFDIEETTARSNYDGRTFYFHATACKRDFDADPLRIIKLEEELEHVNTEDDLPYETMSETGLKPDGTIAFANPPETESQHEGLKPTGPNPETPRREATAAGSE